MSDAHGDDGHDDDRHDIGHGYLGKNRIEALTDGIYAVAMTLLVIDLKVPDAHAIHSPEDLRHALFALLPKAGAWVISFYVLAMFWIGHHRLFQHVRFVDVKLLWRNILQLMLASLLPFSASLIGEYVWMREAQYIYNGNMILLAAAGVWQLRYVHTHPAMQGRHLGRGTYHAALLRNGGLIVAGIIALGIAVGTGSIFATYAYLMMWPIGIVGRRVAARDQVAVAARDLVAPAGSPPSSQSSAPRP